MNELEGLTSERVDDRHVRISKTLPDGTKRSVLIYTFSEEQIAAFQACLPDAYDRVRRERRRRRWARVRRALGIGALSRLLGRT